MNRALSLACLAAGVLGLGGVANAADYYLVNNIDGGRWDDVANWVDINGDPALALPGVGDNAFVGKVGEPVNGRAIGALDADSITVADGSTLNIENNLDGTTIDFLTGSFLEFDSAGANNYTANMADGSTVLNTAAGVLSNTGGTIVLSGMVNFVRDIPDVADRTNETRLDASISGSGGVIVNVVQFDDPTTTGGNPRPTPQGDRIKFREGVTYTGPTIVQKGRLEIADTDSAPGDTSQYIVYDEAQLRFSENKMSHDADMFLLGTSSLLLLRPDDSGDGSGYTINGIVVGGTVGDPWAGIVVPAGVYTTDNLVGTALEGYVVIREGDSGVATLRVLNTIPEPASVALLALGGVCLAARRRRA